MQFGGRYLFGASRLAVWEALNDTKILMAAIPGCTRIEWTSDTALEAEISVNLGVVKPVFKGDLELSGIEPAASYTLTGKGRGGLLGLAHGAAHIRLADAEAGTELSFTATGGASGRIMSLGGKLVGASAQGVIDRFFMRIAAAMQVEVTPLEPGSDPDAITSA